MSEATIGKPDHPDSIHSCPFCGALINGFMDAQGRKGPPRSRDVSCCWECGAVAVFEVADDGAVSIVTLDKYEGFSESQRQTLVWQMAVFTCERRLCSEVEQVQKLYSKRMDEGPGSRYLRFRPKEDDRSIGHSEWVLPEWPPPAEMAILTKNDRVIAVTSLEALKEHWATHEEQIKQFHPVWFVIDRYLSLDGDEVKAGSDRAVGAVYIEAEVADDGRLLHPVRS